MIGKQLYFRVLNEGLLTVKEASNWKRNSIDLQHPFPSQKLVCLKSLVVTKYVFSFHF